MIEVVVSGLVTGWAIAVPIGAVGVFLVAVTARTSLGVGGRRHSASRSALVIAGLAGHTLVS